MGIIQAIVYGIIQGLTEFLPISSTAHLRIFPTLVGWGDPGAAFTAIIQLGTVAAVIIYFGKDIKPAFLAWWNSLTGKKDYDQKEARLAWAVFIGTLPAVFFGLLLQHKIETSFRSLNVIAGSLIVLGFVMLAAEKMGQHKRKVDDVGVKDGIIVGLWQCLALVPGMSRSGTTISGALFQKFDRIAAARFSFLLSIPAVAGAGLYEGFKAVREGKAPIQAGESPAAFAARQIHWGPTVVATIVSFIVGYASIAFFLQYLQRRGIGVFVWYRIVLGVALLVLVQQGMIDKNAGAKPEKQTTAAQTQ
ncbi:MAG TPA: undecaprenyl-diphosphate phosphatase [Fimbriimonadaceae bacterium]|nr:undecaprenyl-diphosphate phosphatase [Fimbriimonadaceae bacterium]